MDNTLPLNILLPLLRALSHKIRTPLSIISNDLSYFKTLIDPAECERGILKARQISEIFKPAQLLQAAGSQQERFSLLELVRGKFPAFVLDADSDSHMEVSGVRDNLAQAFEWLKELFPVSSVRLEGGSFVKLSLCLLKDIEADLNVNSLQSLSAPGSITEIYLRQASDDSILPMLVDAVLFSCSADCQLTSNKEIIINFRSIA